MHRVSIILLVALTAFLSAIECFGADSLSATNSSSAAALPSCIPGVKLGQILISQPNMSSFVFVGNSLVVQWKYTVLVKNKPATVDIKIYLADAPTQITTLVSGLDVSNGATAWLWKVGQISAGSYKAHIVPDGKETLNKKQNQLPCFADGDAMPGTSGAFQISQLQPLAFFPDRFPPNKIGSSMRIIESLRGIVVVLGVAVSLAMV